MFIGDKNFEILVKYKDELKEYYKMKDLGKSSDFFCINFLQDKKNGTISLSQTKYICQKWRIG